MSDRKLCNASKYNVDISAQGEPGSKFGFTTVYPGYHAWVSFKGNEILTLIAEIVVDNDVNSSVIFTQKFIVVPGKYLYNIFNKREGCLTITYDEDSFNFAIV